MPREGCERLGAERSGARERSAPCSSLTGVQRRERPKLLKRIVVFQAQKKPSNLTAFSGDPDRIRTRDPQITKLLLYPAELPDRFTERKYIILYIFS